jgi:hypothetical protein
MANSQNIFESWLSSQQKSVENFVETTKKFQESVTKGDLMQKSTEIYQDWLSKQKAITEETTQLGQELVEQIGLNKNGTATMPPFLDEVNLEQFTATQKKMLEEWTEMMKKATETWSKFDVSNVEQEVKKMYDFWNSTYQQLSHVITQPIIQLQQIFNGQAFVNPATMFDAMKIYTSAYQMWEQMQKAIGTADMNWLQNINAQDFFSKYIDQDQYKAMIDSLFPYTNPGKFKEMYVQIESYLKPFYDSALAAQKQWIERSKEMTTNYEQNMEHLSAFLNSSPYVSQMKSLYAHLFKLMPGGKEKEMFESALDLQESYSDYWKKMSEFQYVIYTASRQAMEKIIEETLEKAQKGTEPESFNTFFTNWLNTTEETLTETFKETEYSKLQGELLATGLEIKKKLEKQLEHFLGNYPIVTRSEADELYRIVHDLKAKVRSLEKEIHANTTVVTETTEEPVAKKTTTKKKAETQTSIA